MNIKNSQIIFGLVISLGLFSCVTEGEKVEGPFTDVIDFENEKTTHTSGLTKRVYTSIGIESKAISTPDWNKELQPFVDANFNTPANAEKYTRSEIKGTLSNWRDVSWVSKEKDAPVQWAVYRYIDSACVGAYLSVNKTSTAYQFTEMLTYLPHSGYSIENSQEITNVSGNSFYLSGEFEGTIQPWRMFFEIGDQNIPVNFWLGVDANNEPALTFVQGKERFTVVANATDSGYVAHIPVFQAYLLFTMDEKSMQGGFHNLDKGTDYVVPFTGDKLLYDQAFGYDPTVIQADFSGKWETYFYDNGDSSKAIGMFERFGDELIGTFATETGDYRFLQGKIVGDSFSLSTFDGSHLFLFTGRIKGNEMMDGHFYSGTHYHATWSAKRNDNVTLVDPNSMTSLREKGAEIEFTFPNLSGKSVSLSDDRFKDKVVVLQILGSWCPNCMDETRYFKEVHEKYHEKGLEIIGLGFERSTDFNVASAVLSKAIQDLDVPYEVLVAGTPKQSALALPMITPIKSYPTSIFINRSGEVVKIHTGFYGPSTGKYYDDYRAETEQFLEELLGDK